MTDTQAWIRIERDFDAPIEKVWSMWTDAKLFQSWYGPRGFTVPVAEIDLTVGGTRKISMEMVTPDRTMTMWFIGVFKEISAPTRLVYTESMCEADGTLIPPAAMGMPEGTPDVTEVIVELTALDGGTRMTMVHAGVPEGTAGEGGWNQAFDKLAQALGG
ncbi:SRPBCC domain-containing protein [Maritimibacter sp. UBA3975]|uniref:SRPBCC family protein n=1 Tax=Maritimibacter sp. UBA3975 TaxID=1946833 RepID=UPI000C08EB4D|nr:SRPBCC domain-containing protein [Maritimibacter sp. UBA3975]MAM61938.1 ATPase [Maritimibacter sp.]|tara:strand:- start:29346 stop:29825 length:480 start_codon:yes stop_codon:yes gene_type:complete